MKTMDDDIRTNLVFPLGIIIREEVYAVWCKVTSSVATPLSDSPIRYTIRSAMFDDLGHGED